MSRSFHLLLGVLVVATVGCCVYGTHAAKLAVTPAQLLSRVGLPLISLGLVFFYRWRRVEKLKNLFEVAFWATTLGCLYAVPVYLIARQKGAFQDALLAHWDRRLGLEVPAVLAALDRYPILHSALEISYDGLIPLIFFALVLPVLCDQLAAVKEYILANVFSAVIAMPLFAAFPAIGPWYYYGYAPNAEQERTTQIFLALKSEAGFTLGHWNLAGIVAFPSFHTIMAVLSAVALWRIPYVRWFAALLAGLIVVSTVTTGWHYVVDVLAGLAIAALALAAARGYAWLEGKWDASPPTGQTADSAGRERMR
jgi:membrane-associated phospholipid phosphatase